MAAFDFPSFEGWQIWNLCKRTGMSKAEAQEYIKAKLRRGGRRGGRAHRGMKYKKRES